MSQQINLFNPAFRTQRKRFSAQSLASLLGAAAVAMGIAIAYASQEARELERRVAAGKAILATQQAAQAEAIARLVPRPKDPGLDTQLAQMQAEIAALREADSVLRGGHIGNHAGYAGYFRALAQQSVPGVWLTGLRIAGAGHEIEVRGRSLQAAAIPGYIAQLQNRPAFHGKTFAALTIAPPAEGGAPAGVAAPMAAPTSQAAAMVAPAGPVAAPFVEFTLQSHVEAAQ